MDKVKKTKKISKNIQNLTPKTKTTKSRTIKSTKKSEFVVNKNTSLAEVLLNIPNAYKILAQLGVPCVTCPLMGMEMHYLSLEAIASMYKLNLDKIITELNSYLKD